MKMNIEKPDITPICCSKEAKWVVQSPNLAYWYCSICKCEPKPVEQSDWYGLQATLDEINAGINKANGLSNCNHSGLAAWLPSPGAPPLVLPPSTGTPAPATGVAPVPAGTPHWSGLVSVGSKWASANTGVQYEVTAIDYQKEIIEVECLTGTTGRFGSYPKDDFFKLLIPLP